jgi:diphosphomevalonate decarboxylase
MTQLAVTARAHTNIALIKYWGKADTTLMLPANSSVSLTLDKFYTDTTVRFDDKLKQDQFILDNQRADGAATAKITKFLDHVRALAGITTRADVVSTNHVPTAAGLASSASAYAALALAASRAAGLQLSHRELTRLARRGSGSASRSLDGGCVIWHRGVDDATSFAEPVAVNPALQLRMIAVVIDHHQKKVSSRAGMAETVATSPYFTAWAQTAEANSQEMVTALAGDDFDRIGALAERSALMMHATTLSANPPFTYFQPETLATLQFVQELRASGLPAYATMDAGPNVKVLTNAANVDVVAAKLRAHLQAPLTICAPGPAASVLKEERHA